MILFASYSPSEEHKRFVGSSDAGKSDPMLWMIINQLQTFQTKLTNLEHKVETKSSKQFDKLGKQFSGLKTKLIANSKKIADLKNDVKVIKNGKLCLYLNVFVLHQNIQLNTFIISESLLALYLQHCQ